MTIGSIQLAAYGKENKYLNGNPQVTFFSTVQKRHTHFARKTITMYPETSSPDHLSPTTPTVVRIKVPRHADLLHKTYLLVRIPDIYSHAVEGFRWVRGLGVAMLDKVVLRIGGAIIQTLTRDWLWIQAHYDYPLDKQDQWYKLVGNTPDLYNPIDPIKNEYPSSKSIEELFVPRSQMSNTVQSLKAQIRRANQVSQPRVPSIVGRDLRVPLTFFFHQNVGKALPLVGIQYADVELEVHFRPYTELFTVRSAARAIDTLRSTVSTNKISKEIRNALERDPPTPYVSPAANANMLLNNGEVSSSNIVRYLAYGDSYQQNSWNLQVRLEADYIYLKENERRAFALTTHEFLIDDIYQDKRPVAIGDSSVEYRIFHPVRQMFWWLQRNDTEETNEWFNWTQSDSAAPYLDGIRDSVKGRYGVANNEYPIRAFQDSINETMLGKDRINPSEIWLQDEHLQRGIIPNFFLKGIYRSPQVADPTAQQCLHLLYRNGFKTRFGNWFLKRLQHVTNIQHLAKLKQEAYEFIDLWKYRHPNDIPIINRTNYKQYLEHAMETAVIRIHNHRDSMDEIKSAEYWNLVTSWNFHPNGFPLPGCYCNSFALEPFADRPTGSLNASMIESITIKMKINEPPKESRVSNTTININPFINRRKTMSITVDENETGNLTGSTLEYPLNPLTSLPDMDDAIITPFELSANLSSELQSRTDDIISFLQSNVTAGLPDYVPQSNLSISIPYGNYTYEVTAQEPSVPNSDVESITWSGLMDDVVISNFEYYQENRLDYPQLIEKGSLLENKDPMEIYNDAAIRRADSMDATEDRGDAEYQWDYSINAIFHRWNVVRIENGLARKVFAN